MAALRETDVRALLELVSESNSQRSLRDFRTGILPGLRRLVPCDVATYNEVEPRQRAISLADPEDALDALADPGATLARLGEQNPLIGYYSSTRDGRAYKISDFIGLAEFHELDIYREAYSKLRVEHQMAFALPSQPTVVIGLALSREHKDFSERDRTVLNLARPHLIQAHRNVAAYARLHATMRALARGLGEHGEGVATLGHDGGLEFASPYAMKLLEAHFRGWNGRGGRLPEPLAEAIAAGGPGAPVVFDGADGTLVARHLPSRASDEPDALLLELRSDPLSVAAVQALGLTRRQAEVLRLVALGRSTGEVARELGITPATARKHLENVYARLGVSSRAAAAATAWAGAETRGFSDEE